MYLGSTARGSSCRGLRARTRSAESSTARDGDSDYAATARGSRPAGPRVGTTSTTARVTSTCYWCGAAPLAGRQTCSDECTKEVLAQVHQQRAGSSSDRMKRLARQPDHPALTAEANRRRSATHLGQIAQQRAWGQSTTNRATLVVFRARSSPSSRWCQHRRSPVPPGCL